jgi:ABC-type sugar transport system substrate-binding protein
MKNRLNGVIVVLFIAAILASCSKANTKTANDGQLVIGVSVDTLDQAYWQADMAAMEDQASKLGVKLNVLVAEGDAVKQNQQIETLISQKVAAIVCIAVDCDAVLEAVKKANAAKIPFIFNDRGIFSTNDSKVDYGIGTDNYSLAKQAAEWFVSYLRKNNISGKAVVFIGDLGDSNAIERNRGYQEVIKANSDIIQVVAEVPTEWNLEKALSGTINAFQANPDATIIFSPADYIFPSIRSGLQQLNKWHKRGEGGHVWFTSFDGDREALDALKDTYIESIGAQPILETGANCIQAAVDFAGGKKMSEEYHLSSGFVVNVDNFNETAKNASGYFGVN